MYNYDINSPEQREAYKRAERRVQAKIGFYWHLASYIVVNGLLIVIYLLTGPLPGLYSYPWFVWPMFGWGIGLFFHFMGVFVFNGSNSENVKQQMIQEELRRMGVPSVQSPSQQVPPDRR